MMFTVYHAAVFIAIFVFGVVLGHHMGQIDGYEKCLKDVERELKDKKGGAK